MGCGIRPFVDSSTGRNLDESNEDQVLVDQLPYHALFQAWRSQFLVSSVSKDEVL